jgi:fibronectin type 3 domain-containing protein
MKEAPVQNLMRKIWLPLVVVALSAAAVAQQSPQVRTDIRHDVSPPLRSIEPQPVVRGELEFEPVMRIHPKGPQSVSPDTVIQTSAGPTVATTPGLSLDGVGQGFSGPQGTFVIPGAPPDTEGVVGATQYVQWVNTSFAIFDKTTGATLYGPAAGNTIWAGFGGLCQTSNNGDPIVQYDKINNRWIMTQFAFSSATSGPWYQCIAVSTTADATGTWNRYAYQFTALNDYPKLGVWPDGYYMSFNMFTSGAFFAGSRLCAYDGAAMRAGGTATQVCFQTTTAYGGLLPSDLDGSTLPPVGTPNYYLAFGTNQLQLWKFHVDFVTPANSTFTGPTLIPVAGFSEACGGGTCIPQRGTTQQLDSLGDRLMYRLAFRQFADHHSVVVNHSVTAGSSVGVRWYELRNLDTTPVVYQQSTYAPDSNYRWMGSIGMDKVGNMALGYSVSSSSMYPTIAYTGRVSTDALNTMQAETTVQLGGGSQTGGLSRWGDYSAMTIDPVNDCTFWYTQEYLKTTGSFNWNTHINSFSFPSCTSGSPPPAPTGLTASAGSGIVNLSWNASTGATSYKVYRSTTSGSGYANIGSSTTTSFSDTTVINGTTYYYVVTALNANGESGYSNEASATPMGSGGAIQYIGQTNTAPQSTATCTVTRTGVSAGNLLVIFQRWYSGSNGLVVSSQSDSLGNTIQTAAQAVTASGYRYGRVAYIQNASAGTHTISTTLSAIPSNFECGVAEFSGVATAGALDGAATTKIGSSGTSLVGNPYTPSQTGDLIIGYASQAGGTYTANGSFIIGAGMMMTYSSGEYQVYASTSPIAGSFTSSGSGEWAVITAGFKAGAQGPPAPPTNLTATAGNAQVSLSWTGSAGATSYNVYRSTTSGSGYAMIATSATTNYTDTTVINGTTYYYVVTAVNANGESGYSNEASATPQPPPPAPTGLTATAGNSQVALLWNASTGATSYKVYRSTTSGSGYANIATSATTSYTDYTVVNGTTYYYVVTAVNAYGESGYSNETSATPQGSGSTPQFIGQTNTAPQSTATCTVTRTGVGAGNLLVIFQRWYSGSNGLTVSSQSDSLGNTINTVAQAVTATGYRYGRVAYIQNASAGTHTISTTLSALPSNFECGVAEFSGVATAGALDGAATTKIGSSGTSLVGNPYTPSQTGDLIIGYASQAGGAYTATGGFTIGAGMMMTYSSGEYQVYASTSPIAGSFTSSGSGEWAVITAGFKAGVQGPPAPPTNLTATAGNAQVSLSWTGSAGATSYNVYRSTTSGSGYTNIGSSATTNFTDTTVINGTTYYYVVTALNTNGESGYSNEASATPQAAPPAPTGLTATAGNSQVALTWNASTGATSYKIYRSTTSGSGYANIGSSATTNYTDYTVINGITYYYVVTAVNAYGESGYSNEVSATPQGTGTKQFIGQTNTAPQSTATCTVTRTNVGAGNLLVIFQRWYSGVKTLTVSSQSDSLGNTINTVAQAVTATGYRYGRVAYIQNATAGTHTITTTLSGVPSNFECGVAEFSGVATTNALDGAATVKVGSSGTSLVGNPYTPTQTGDLIIGYASQAGGTYTANGGFIIGTGMMMTYSSGEYQVYGSTAPIAGSFTSSGSGEWSVITAGFK